MHARILAALAALAAFATALPAAAQPYVFVDVRPVELSQRVAIHREVSRDPVQDHADAPLVQEVDHVHEILGRAESAAARLPLRRFGRRRLDPASHHARFPAAGLYAVGVSLGGNMLAKWLGERGRDADFVAAAASIGSPLDLAAGGAALGRGFNLVYTKMFLATLKDQALEKMARFPQVGSAEAIRASSNLYEFDNAYTAPVHGFRDTDDYWSRVRVQASRWPSTAW